jgi:RecB family exonuclease
MVASLFRSSDADERLGKAHDWLVARPHGEEVLIVAASPDAANDLLRGASIGIGRCAAFGWHRATLTRLAATLAGPRLAERGLAPVSALAAQAVVARVVHELRARGSLGRYTEVATSPGFDRAVARTLMELRLARVEAESLARHAPELAAIARAYQSELVQAGLADRSSVLELATEAARDTESLDAWLALPTLLLDVPVENAAERDLVASIAMRAPEVLATVATGDARSLSLLGQALPGPARAEGSPDSSSAGSSLSRLRRFLFEEAAPAESPLDDTVSILSAPGESRECVEIARRILREAESGTPFDQMAVLLRSAEEYRPHLAEAFARSGIPVHFARGARRPDPAGRAFLALLACKADGLSARCFAEYLSLGEVPDAAVDGSPPQAEPAAQRWVAPDEELVSEVVAEALGEAARQEPGGLASAPERAPVAAGRLRAPRRFEKLLCDAAVIGGRQRWERRLRGLARELSLDLEELDDPDGPRAEVIRAGLEDLEALRSFALPLLDELEALPARAPWGPWLDALSALASRALRRPDRVLAVLAELVPMQEMGMVDLDEVAQVLSGRLLEVALPPSKSRYGGVYVAPAEAARGLAFDVVFVPGLAEKLFPRKIAEEPILLDAVRERLGAGLAKNQDRVAAERLALRLAVGAARRRVVLSYPRLDLDQSRPRVPSFYALEALRACEGRLPGFDELATRAERLVDARVGWPAPSDARDAIDEAEHDLALLASLLDLDPEQHPERVVGTARYLLESNPHLGRALRFRARRWLRRWTPADGLLDPMPAALEAIQSHGLGKRSFSPTALQHYAQCPYRFFLYSVHRLAPREVPEAIEQMNPLQRGSLVHEVQFELLGRLRDEKLLPVTPVNLARCQELLEEVQGTVVERTRDDLAPAIDRVWQDGVASIRADLREWLRRVSQDHSGFVPWRFELAFGLTHRRASDPHSAPEPVELDCGIRLRGSIDQVERAPGDRLRVTDHKTGKERFQEGDVIAGGTSLQPVFYALATEKLFPEAAVDSGRLYYCTAAGGFQEREVPLDDVARRSADDVGGIIGTALERGFLPAAPAARACEWCDYRVVCGPYEEHRTGRKPAADLEPLRRLREMR